MSNPNEKSELAWMAEARKHIGVKEVPGKDNNPTIIGWLKILKASWSDDSTPWCLEGDIEVLTSVGFVRLDSIDVIKPKEVAQLNPKTLEVEFTSDFDYIEKDYDGVVYDVNAGRLNFTCDPNHKMFGGFSSSDQYKLREISSLTKYGVKIPKIHSSSAGIDCTDDELIFLAAYLSDGTRRHNIVRFKFSKQRKMEIMDKFPYLSKKTDDKLYGVSRKVYTNYAFSIALLRMDYLCKYKLLSWEFLRGLSQRQAKVFIDAYKNFDGTQSSGEPGYEVFTADKQLQQQLNYIATMAGYKSTPFSVKQTSPLSKIEYLHHVYVSPKKHRHVSKDSITKRDFNGKLYCLSVPSSVMIIKCRNGVIIPIGNCGTFAAISLQRANRFVPKEKFRALAYLDAGIRLSKPAYGCIVVFKRDGGGHVGFVAGKDKSGNLMVLGGNQNDMVCISPFKFDRVVGYIWPALANGQQTTPHEFRYDLPILNSLGVSTTISVT